MIERDDIEKVRSIADGGELCPPPPRVLRELCRVYLAWMEAPEAVLSVKGDLGMAAAVELFGAEGSDLMMSLEKVDDKRVRLVEVKE